LAELFNGLLECSGICSRRREWEISLSDRLEAVAVDTKLSVRIEITTVHSRTTTCRALNGVWLSLERLPGGLLGWV
jgi:hypothetical protein